MNKMEMLLVFYVTTNLIFVFWRFYFDVYFLNVHKKNMNREDFFKNEISVLRSNFKEALEQRDDWKNRYMKLMQTYATESVSDEQT